MSCKIMNMYTNIYEKRYIYIYTYLVEQNIMDSTKYLYFVTVGFTYMLHKKQLLLDRVKKLLCK